MNTLEEIYQAVKEMISIIHTAYSAGMYKVTRDLPNGYLEHWELDRDGSMMMSICNQRKRIFLDLRDFGNLAHEFETIYFLACKSVEYVKTKLDKWNNTKRILTPFVLEEKLKIQEEE